MQGILDSYQNILPRITKPSIINTPHIISIQRLQALILKLENLHKLLEQHNHHTSIGVHGNPERSLEV